LFLFPPQLTVVLCPIWLSESSSDLAMALKYEAISRIRTAGG
jgi:hypothetical protein